MWVQAGFSPDTFWQQTPIHFQMAMKGTNKRLESEAENRMRQAWQTGAFTGATQSKSGLKPFKHYWRKVFNTQPTFQTPQEMLTVFRTFKSKGANMTIKRIKLGTD